MSKRSNGNANANTKSLYHTTALTTLFVVLTSSYSTYSFAQQSIQDEIVVTGSRIQNPNLAGANPITSIDSLAISQTGKTSIQDIVAEVGSLVGSSGEDEVSDGENFLNLRNLGTNRTLTLVDGHRFVSGSVGSSAVDTNSIPLAMIERVDVLTGGVSAIYGADAVTGVVNFILKKDFEGLALNAQYGDAQHGDFSDQQYSLTAGHNFADDRANVAASYTYGKRPITLATARPQAGVDLFERINNQNGTVPQFVLAQGTNESFFTNGGALIDPFNIFSSGFNGDGTAFRHGTNIGSFAGTGEIGGDGIPNFILFANGIRPGNERHVFSARAHYDVSEGFQPYISINYADVDTEIAAQHSLTVGSQVKLDNAFLPTAVFDEINTLGYGGPIFFNRWDLDAGFNNRDVNKKTHRILLGAKGDISNHLRYDVSANFGKSKRHETIANNKMFDRYIAAIDAVDDGAGNIVCRSNLDPASFNSLPGDFITTSFDSSQGASTFTPGANSGCLAYNPFTTDNASNQAAIDWIFQATSNTAKNTQTVINGYLAGDSGAIYELPGGAIDFVVGGEYRKEKVDSKFDALSSTAQQVAFNSGADLAGEFDVKEVFGEVSMPIFKDAGTFLNELTVDGAYRYSDYSTIGTTSTWKIGAIWEPVDSLSIRGTISSAVRAPNIGELFTPQTSISLSLAEDPCHINNINLGSSTRAANCATELNALGVDPTTFQPLLGIFFPGLSGGSPDLKEEVAKTKTVGFIWQPSFINRFSLSVDYFDIKIEDAVITPNITAIFNSCYDSATLNNVFCSLLGRDSTTGAANFVELQSVNVAEIQTAGIEFSANYGLEINGYGDFKLGLNGTYLDKLLVQKSELPILVDDKGLFNTATGGSSPNWVLSGDLNWRFQNWDVNYGVNYHSQILRSPLINAQRENAANIIDEPFVKAFINHDVQVGYQLRETAHVYAGIRNLTNELPDKVRASLNSSSGRQGYAGRTIYIGVNMQFDSIWK